MTKFAFSRRVAGKAGVQPGRRSEHPEMNEYTDVSIARTNPSREQSVTRLMGTIKEHEATIKKLSESSDSWKRKYQFLATDTPEAYKSAAEKKAEVRWHRPARLI